MSKKAKEIAAVVAAVILSAIIIWKCVQLIPLKNAVENEMKATATPTPKWGNVMMETPDSAVPTKVHLLKTGSFGNSVVELQRRLQELGYYDGEIDGQFGAGTKEAVAAFQLANGLDSDGIAGEDTLNALYGENPKACEKED